MTRKLRLTLASILAVAALGAIAPAANAYVYWTNEAANTIGRAKLDGTSVNQSFITVDGASGPYGVAVDGNYIYWTNSGNDTIGRAKLDGTSVSQSFITGASGPFGVTVDGNYIYWTNGANATIGRANLNGSGVDQSLVTGLSDPTALAASGNHIYWTEPSISSIGRANVNGTGVDQSFITGASGPFGVTVDGNYIYWTTTFSKIGRANLDGTVANQNFKSIPGGQAAGLAVDDKYVYFGSTSDSNIGRILLDSFLPAEFPFISVPGSSGLWSLAVDPLPYPSPTITRAAKPTKRSLKVRVGCGDSNTCMLRLTGKKVGNGAAIRPKTVSVGAGEQPTVTLRYSPSLRRAVARGGRVSVTATNMTTNSKKSIVVQVAR